MKMRQLTQTGIITNCKSSSNGSFLRVAHLQQLLRFSLRFLMTQSPITKIQEDRFGQRKKLSQFFFFLVAQNWGKRRKERGYVRAIYSKLIELATTAKFCYDFHMGVITSFLCTTVLVCSGIYLYCITAAKTYTSKYHTVESWHCCQESRSSTFHTKRSFQMPKKTQNCT